MPILPADVAVEAVIGELVSKGDSLITGKIQGIFANLAPKPGRGFVLRHIDQCLAAKFPARKNREFFPSIREFKVDDQGTGEPIARSLVCGDAA
jgi:hypothetical protein